MWFGQASKFLSTFLIVSVFGPIHKSILHAGSSPLSISVNKGIDYTTALFWKSEVIIEFLFSVSNYLMTIDWLSNKFNNPIDTPNDSVCKYLSSICNYKFTSYYSTKSKGTLHPVPLSFRSICCVDSKQILRVLIWLWVLPNENTQTSCSVQLSNHDFQILFLAGTMESPDFIAHTSTHFIEIYQKYVMIDEQRALINATNIICCEIFCAIFLDNYSFQLDYDKNLFWCIECDIPFQNAPFFST